LKRVLKDVVTSDPAFVRDIVLEAIRGDGRVIEAIIDLIARSPEARLRLAETVAGVITIPLNVTTKQDLEKLREEMATKEDIKRLEERIMGLEGEVRGLKDRVTSLEVRVTNIENRMTNVENRVTNIENRMADIEKRMTNIENRMSNIENRMTNMEKRMTDIENRVTNIENRMITREEFDKTISDIRSQIKDIKDRMLTREEFERRFEWLALNIEGSARDWVSYLLRQRGYNCTAERLYVDLDGVHEIDIYCNAGTITVVGEAKVRVGSEVVKDVYYRAQEVRRRYPDKVSGRLVPAIYTMAADPSAVDKARELGVWIVENNKEKVALEEVLRTGQGG